MLAGSLAAGLFALGMAWLLSAFLASRLLQRDAELSRDFVQSIVDTQQVAAVFESGEVPRDPAFAEFFAHVAAMPDVLRANVYSAGRQVLWSSSPELIGQRFGDNDELDEALAGAVVASFDSEGHKDEHLLLGRSPNEFVENYLPVRRARDQQVVGVVELYRRPVALTAALHDGQQRIWAAAVLGGALLIWALHWFVRRIDAAFAEQQRRLVDQEALAMVGELSAAVAHSIRNPLGSIRSAAELRRELGEDAPLDHEEVIRHVDRIEHLVRTLLTTARRPQDGPAGRCALAPVLQTAAARMRQDCAAQHKPFIAEWPADLGEVALDELLLAQALASVLANASEATASGEAIRLRARLDPDHVTVMIEDEGSGLPADGAQRVTQPFFTTKPRGLGLGLPLARRAVERAGGTLEIGPLPGRGTRVTLTLPRLPAP